MKSSQLTKTKITKREFGDGWPFSVNEGELACVRKGSVAVFFITNGKPYALNVWARGSKIDGKPVLQNASFDLIDGPNMGPVFDKGFAMCSEK